MSKDTPKTCDGSANACFCIKLTAPLDMPRLEGAWLTIEAGPIQAFYDVVQFWREHYDNMSPPAGGSLQIVEQGGRQRVWEFDEGDMDFVLSLADEIDTRQKGGDA